MASKPTRVEVFTEGIEELPVVVAWRSIDPAHAVPRRVEMLRRKNKSLIYRLVGVGVEGSNVIAKACLEDTAFVERTIYLHVLPDIPVTQLRYYGFVSGSGKDFSWLFLEEACGVELDPANAAHRALSTRWLAQLHVASAALTAPPPLPDRGPPHYREHMNEARWVIERGYDNPALDKGEHATLDRILALFDVAETRWAEIEELCEQIPRALIHGDFAERNVQIRSRSDADAGGKIATMGLWPSGADALYAFDWEVSGWGLPVVDLAHADLHLYWTLVRDHWCNLELKTLMRLVHVGKLLRGGIAATNWAALSLTTTWPAAAVSNMKVYDRRMTDAMRGIGWAA
jgi:hypothetical protein